MAAILGMTNRDVPIKKYLHKDIIYDCAEFHAFIVKGTIHATIYWAKYAYYLECSRFQSTYQLDHIGGCWRDVLAEIIVHVQNDFFVFIRQTASLWNTVFSVKLVQAVLWQIN